MSITNNLTVIAENIKHAVNNRKDGIITPAEIKLIAVTKNHGVEAMQEAIDYGIAAIGENRIQEAMGKAEVLARQVEWHLIGHLQTNKVKNAVALFDLIHSVDSEKLAVEINRAAAKIGKRQHVLMQLNVSGEDTKFGLDPGKMLQLARCFSNLEHVCLNGIMTIAPFYEDAEKTRLVFKNTYLLYCELVLANLSNTRIEWLSMGMTNDYKVAIEEGANMVRIGTGIFGERRY